jgi:hypothetical protein
VWDIPSARDVRFISATKGGDAAGDMTRDEHRGLVRGRQQDRHESIPLGELLAGLDLGCRG